MTAPYYEHADYLAAVEAIRRAIVGGGGKVSLPSEVQK